MMHNLRFFSLQNAVYFIMLPCLVPVLFVFYLQGVYLFYPVALQPISNIRHPIVEFLLQTFRHAKLETQILTYM